MDEGSVAAGFRGGRQWLDPARTPRWGDSAPLGWIVGAERVPLEPVALRPQPIRSSTRGTVNSRTSTRGRRRTNPLDVDESCLAAFKLRQSKFGRWDFCSQQVYLCL
jgi:hypothetical protein